MKKLLVFSDSHGDVQTMAEVVSQHVAQGNIDRIIHLGDCWADASALQERFPEIPMDRVPGNCDSVMEPEEKILLIGGKRILICHGHIYRVKSGVLTLEYAAIEKEVDLAMFGHTHRMFFDWHNGVQLYNPGSIGAPGYDVPASYGVVTIDNGEIHIETQYLQ